MEPTMAMLALLLCGAAAWALWKALSLPANLYGDAQQILQGRFARGEIDKAQYEDMRRAIMG